jgi:hypothetical protein
VLRLAWTESGSCVVLLCPPAIAPSLGTSLPAFPVAFALGAFPISRNQSCSSRARLPLGVQSVIALRAAGLPRALTDVVVSECISDQRAHSRDPISARLPRFWTRCIECGAPAFLVV